MKKIKSFSDFLAKVQAVWIMRRTSEQKSVTLRNLILVLIEIMMFLFDDVLDNDENVCCRKRTCVTSYAMYDTSALTLAVRARFDILAEEPD